MNYNLFLDDARDPSDVKHALHGGIWQEFPQCYTWQVVRSYDQFVYYITNNGMPLRIAFDHDLGDQAYVEFFLSKEENREFDYSKLDEKTGYDCAKWLVEYCTEKNLPLPEFYVHSFNPAGRMNIFNCLSKYHRDT